MDCSAGVWRDFTSFFPRDGSNHSRVWSLFPFRQLACTSYRYPSSARSSGGSDCLGSGANPSIACFFGPLVRVTAHCLGGRYSPYAQRCSVSDRFPPSAVGHLLDCLLSSSPGM